MRLLKRLDKYLLINFLGSFLVTLFICSFILLMQFIWMHVNDLVGKGVELKILVEFFIYAVANVLPMALPLAILLASLISFGNLGEKFELIAMQASGISLFRVMLPLIITVMFISVGAFAFSNNILPKTQVKLWALIFSLRQKSPELDIPEGEFYSQLRGYKLYVRHKNVRTGLLQDLMIYDYSSGFKDAKVMMADSGRVSFTEDKKYMVLYLYNGESFENLNEQQQRATKSIKNVPYRRETFSYKTMLIDFDTELNRFDDQILKEQHIAKDAYHLLHSVDSVRAIKNAKERELGLELVQRHYLGREQMSDVGFRVSPDSIPKVETLADSLYAAMSNKDKHYSLQLAIERAKAKKNHIDYNAILLRDNETYIRKHLMEFYRKFTLAFACLVFFFIGAPLGSIVRRGGLGFPVIISVVFFIIYYIIDNVGYKMAKESIWPIWGGMWLSSFVILPFGVWLTYVANTDSELFNLTFWIKLYEKIYPNILSPIKKMLKRPPTHS